MLKLKRKHVGYIVFLALFLLCIMLMLVGIVLNYLGIGPFGLHFCFIFVGGIGALVGTVHMIISFCMWAFSGNNGDKPVWTSTESEVL